MINPPSAAFRVLQSLMHALAAEQSDAEAEERAGLRPWRMGAVGCMVAKAPGRARATLLAFNTAQTILYRA